jgi:methylglutaconyl-CoA hydratase
MLEQIIDGSIARVWLDRPAVRNALDEHLIAALTSTLHALASREDIQVIVLAGRGEAFCAGGDLRWMQRMATASRTANIEDALGLAGLFQTLDSLPQPTVARIHGACVGGALGLVGACDIAVAADSSRFALSEVRLGLVPATISPYVLRAIGHRTASRYMLTAETFGAETARQIGLVHEVAADAALDLTIDRLVSALLEGGRYAQGATKRLLRELQGRRIDDQVAARTAEVIADARASDEAQRRLRRFFDTRRP